MNEQEKAYLKGLVEKELEHFRKEKKTLFIDIPPQFLKGEHDFEHFLEGLLKKL